MSVNGTDTVTHVLPSQSTLQRSVMFAEAAKAQVQVQTQSTSALETATGILAGTFGGPQATFPTQPTEELPSATPTTIEGLPPQNAVQENPPANDTPTSTSSTSARTVPKAPSPPSIALEIPDPSTTLMTLLVTLTAPPVTPTPSTASKLSALAPTDSSVSSPITSNQLHASYDPSPSSPTTTLTKHPTNAKTFVVGFAVITGILALALLGYVVYQLRKRLFARRHCTFRDLKAPVNEELLEALPEPYNLNPFDATSANKVDSLGMVIVDANSHVERDPFADDPLGRTSRTSSLPSYRS